MTLDQAKIFYSNVESIMYIIQFPSEENSERVLFKEKYADKKKQMETAIFMRQLKPGPANSNRLHLSTICIKVCVASTIHVQLLAH